MSPNQIGAVPGHRSQEHLFTVKSLIALTEKNNDALALQLFDLKKYFDRECLQDCLGELYRANVKGKLYKLLYELNKDTRIRVRTAVGDSEPREINEGVAQGSMEGSLISSLGLSKGATDFFATSECEISYGPVIITACEFQDDIFQACKDPLSAQLGNDRLEALAETKLLDFHTSKSKIILIGKEKAREQLRKEFEENPPLLYGEKVPVEDQETYLGDELGFSLS